MSINLLTVEIKDKNSTLARSGEERVNTVNGVLAETKKRNVSGEGHLKGKFPPPGRSEYERSRINFTSVSVVKK